ncbi:MAG: OmpA family protein [Candidatus Eisenbacteria bacterium]|uniref:OmpA family protein n=1 Tax=Eiseniibacteriota bacterium TaxID=2212470 RepID=A0A538SWC1_UNCEI|nr:MAG: OmpA family protein [Candidatus Eisenbacteria bacterium]
MTSRVSDGSTYRSDCPCAGRSPAAAAPLFLVRGGGRTLWRSVSHDPFEVCAAPAGRRSGGRRLGLGRSGRCADRGPRGRGLGRRRRLQPRRPNAGADRSGLQGRARLPVSAGLHARRPGDLRAEQVRHRVQADAELQHVRPRPALEPAPRGQPGRALPLVRRGLRHEPRAGLHARKAGARRRHARHGAAGERHQPALLRALQWNFFGKVRDQDLDKVRDWLDHCPNTPLGAAVDAHGCPEDADGDGVLDGLDKCPNTPKGCTVDKKGCPSDQDGDGVCDGVDKCPDTPKGCTVDAFGCPADPDSDGVCDGVDKCPNTPKGCTVDAKGCPSDADADGVCDGVDVCPNTPRGYKVDAHGCPIEVNEKETELLDTGMIRLENIQFETKKAVLKPVSITAVEEAARVLQQYPQLKVEIGGHCDNRGSKAMNDTLSDSRARAVLEYVKANFPAIPSSQYSSKGYGFSRPIASNANDAGRARNRRVEFKVLNTGTLRTERNRRHFLRTGESAPPEKLEAPKSAPPDSTKR